MQARQIPDGQFTATVYTLIREGRLEDVVTILTRELQTSPRSRAALSLLGYCYYSMQDFRMAATMYEQLIRYFPEVNEYRVYHAQSLYKAGAYDESTKACQSVTSQQYTQRLLIMQAAAKYETEELNHAKIILSQCAASDPEAVIIEAAIMYKEDRFEEARVKFQEALSQVGYQCDLAYNVALCYFKMKQYAPCLKFIAEIIEKGVREHPELGVGSNAEGVDVKSVGNTQILKETALIEAFNLKAAIEFVTKNYAAAKEALLDMPPRSEEELDPVTLHNQGLANMDTDPAAEFKKFNFLLQNPPFPVETFSNLLILCCKYNCYDMAADVLADKTELTFKCLSPEDFEYLDALIMCQTSPEHAYQKFDMLANQHVDSLRKLTKQIQDARMARDGEEIKRALVEYDKALERYIPVLMAQAKIYWDMENYEMVEKLFRQSAEFCSEHEIWQLNVAHCFFMQENRFQDAIHYYEMVVARYEENLLDLTAIVLANLCVAYIMNNQNEEAEEIMRRIEHEEDKISYQDPDRQLFHLCIVNLVIGTLYCSKGNYEFGVSRVIRSLDPYPKKLGTDTWFYAKRCFVALIEAMAKHMVVLKDQSFAELLVFFDAAEEVGKSIYTVLNPKETLGVKHTVAYEARALKAMFLRLRE
jgi:tetratricopeptide repeat protein 30